MLLWQVFSGCISYVYEGTYEKNLAVVVGGRKHPAKAVSF